METEQMGSVTLFTRRHHSAAVFRYLCVFVRTCLYWDMQQRAVDVRTSLAAPRRSIMFVSWHGSNDAGATLVTKVAEQFKRKTVPWQQDEWQCRGHCEQWEGGIPAPMHPLICCQWAWLTSDGDMAAVLFSLRSQHHLVQQGARTSGY